MYIVCDLFCYKVGFYLFYSYNRCENYLFYRENKKMKVYYLIDKIIVYLNVDNLNRLYICIY